MNDSRVTAVSINTVLACQAYILFYSRHITHTLSSLSLSIMTNQGKASIESSTALAAVSSLQPSDNIDISNNSSYSSNTSVLNYNSNSTTTSTTATTTSTTSQLKSPILTTICRFNDDNNNAVVGMNVSPNHLNNSDIIINNNNSMISDDSTDSSINDVDVGNAIIDSSSSMIKACRLAPRFSVYVTPFRYCIVVSQHLSHLINDYSVT